jgi:hypothetical protein
MLALSLAVAVAFGLIMGWTLGRILDDLGPVIITLGAGSILGAVTWAMSTDASTATAGGSLLLGCAAGLVGLIPHRRPTP